MEKRSKKGVSSKTHSKTISKAATDSHNRIQQFQPKTPSEYYLRERMLNTHKNISECFDNIRKFSNYLKCIHHEITTEINEPSSLPDIQKLLSEQSHIIPDEDTQLEIPTNWDEHTHEDPYYKYRSIIPYEALKNQHVDLELLKTEHCSSFSLLPLISAVSKMHILNEQKIESLHTQLQEKNIYIPSETVQTPLPVVCSPALILSTSYMDTHLPHDNTHTHYRSTSSSNTPISYNSNYKNENKDHCNINYSFTPSISNQSVSTKSARSTKSTHTHTTHPTSKNSLSPRFYPRNGRSISPR